MTQQSADLTGVAATGEISAQDILSLRRAIWSDGIVDEADAHGILEANARIDQPPAEWTAFLVEAIGTWLVDEQKPQGYVDAAQAAWLMAALDRKDAVATSADIELVVHILERATSAPPALEAFVLARIEAGLFARPAPEGVSASDAAMIRRVLFAPSSDRGSGISQGEAERLFRIKNAMLCRDNDPQWQRLFVQAVGNFLQGFSAAEPVARDRAAELEAFMDRSESMSGFLGRMFGGDGAGNSLKALRAAGWHEHQFADDAEKAHAAETITPEKNAWLAGEIGRDDQVDAYEQALLDFLKQG